MEFLDEVGARKALRELVGSGSTVRIAVAFWGLGAADVLGLDRPNIDLRIVCNLDSGACNPTEIRRLKSLCPDGALRTLPRLHGKVYWTPEGVLLGSSNASSNGLAVEGAELKSWSEANVLLRDQGMIDEIGDWFDRQYLDADPIDDGDIDAAEDVWSKRARSAPTGQRLTYDLIAAFRNDPEHQGWEKVTFIFWSEDLSAAGEDEVKRERKANPMLNGWDCYEDWKEIEAGEQIIEFKLSRIESQFTGYFKSTSPKIETDTLTWVRAIAGIKHPGTPRLTLSDEDKAAIEKHASAISRALPTKSSKWGRGTIGELVAVLDAIRAKDDEEVLTDHPDFKAALFETYRVARTPRTPLAGFVRMLETLGGLETARRLLDAREAQSGLTLLWEEKLLRISVEALSLQPRWRNQFTSNQRKTAAKRLKRYGYSVEDND
ncbi:phospholipase D family protein [Asticcacaulis sp.]|uniref:phospholipase D family protein n=1 Tax=Asticcacaulis sp. TaxID=1872648 RepID=UPI002628358C|nr:phospholipase D family protein [Asticcacaulis sp.]